MKIRCDAFTCLFCVHNNNAESIKYKSTLWKRVGYILYSAFKMVKL